VKRHLIIAAISLFQWWLDGLSAMVITFITLEIVVGLMRGIWLRHRFNYQFTTLVHALYNAWRSKQIES